MNTSLYFEKMTPPTSTITSKMLKWMEIGLLMYTTIGVAKYVHLKTTPSTHAYNEFRTRIDGVTPSNVDFYAQLGDIKQAVTWVQDPLAPSFRSLPAYDDRLDQIIQELHQLIRSMV